jgi:hypothetical protein
MRTKNSKVYQGLFKKLDALRATLSDEERTILDSIFTDEVKAHRLIIRPVSKANKQKTEVAAHRAIVRPASKAVRKVKAQK